MAAADALAKLKVTAGVLGAEGKDLTVSPRVKGNVGPLDLTAWALDAIQAANDAAKDALAHPSPKASWMAKEMAKAKLHGKIAVSLAREKFNLDAALATLAPVRHNATVASVAALLHDVKHANRTELPPKPSLADLEFEWGLLWVLAGVGGWGGREREVAVFRGDDVPAHPRLPCSLFS